MIERYLGKKSAILDSILEVVGNHCEPGGTVTDIFSGSLAVSLGLKREGYNVIANDINLFSYVLGKAFLTLHGLPEVELDELVRDEGRKNEVSTEATVWTSSLEGEAGFEFLEEAENREKFEQILAVLKYLEDAEQGYLPPEFRRTDIADTYTEEGARSRYESQRGSSGRRRFFTHSNGLQIDTILNHLRLWRHRRTISPDLYFVLLACLLRAVEKVSNTQGTFHDFPRDRYDPRSQKKLQFEAPPLGYALLDGQHKLGRERDSLKFVTEIPRHDVIYIDPPYNFRQYTAYYFMFNLLCRYPELNDPEEYFSNVEYVRGQNMEYDYSSPFSKKRTFLKSLKKLIEVAPARTVLLSYFDGRNHSNGQTETVRGRGIDSVKGLFKSDVFRPGTLNVLPVERTNYQSYGGHTAEDINEYLFVAQKREGEL